MRGRCVLSALVIVLTQTSGAWAQKGGCDSAAAAAGSDCGNSGASSTNVPAKFHPGDTITNYTIVADPSKYGLRPYGTYFKSGDYIYLVDQHNMQVLDIVGTASAMVQK